MSAAVATVDTLSVALKERMVLMPDELDTKKEIDEFYKNAMKELAAAKKAVKKNVVKADVKPKKVAKKNLDENGEEKPKRPLTAYQLFLKETQPKMKEAHPELSNTERFAKIAEEWQKHKAGIAGQINEDEEVPPAISPIAEVPDIVKVPDVAKVPEVAKKVAKKVSIVLIEVTPPSTDEEIVPAEPVTEPVVMSAEPVAPLVKKSAPRKTNAGKVRKSIVVKNVDAANDAGDE